MSYTLHLQILISALCLLFCKPSCATPNNGRLDLQLPFVPVKTPPLSKEHNFVLCLLLKVWKSEVTDNTLNRP